MTGLLIGVVAISLSSVMVVLSGAAPEVAGFYRLFGGGLGLLFILARQGKMQQLTPHVWKWGVLAAIFFAGDIVFWHRSIAYVGPGLSTMLANFQVIPLAIVSALFFKERMTVRMGLAIVLVLVGLYLMVGVGWDAFTADYRLGVAYGLLTACFYALYLLSLKYSLAKTGADPLAMAAVAALLSGVLLGGMGVAGDESFVVTGVQPIMALITLALLCHATGWYLITRSIQAVKGALVGLLLLLQPPLSFLWDILLFDKPINVIELAGVGLALVGIYIGSLKAEK
ncbi:DMT family transporter [Pseudodesulfovibrio sediminis]|uniref:EamA domain-containing protein n=1 Tax=Pseudodesulfovibrio sediminis TaxID=2810563 RepID=A0ABN6EUA9_9BACT|nr:DMT family transporter [Pseudodesulfovibrio sediminis]BCS88834.1 hypothetical protein PSDVSF_20760 [Pseudodesulfovibrio sediminis]